MDTHGSVTYYQTAMPPGHQMQQYQNGRVQMGAAQMAQLAPLGIEAMGSVSAGGAQVYSTMPAMPADRMTPVTAAYSAAQYHSVSTTPVPMHQQQQSSQASMHAVPSHHLQQQPPQPMQQPQQQQQQQYAPIPGTISATSQGQPAHLAHLMQPQQTQQSSQQQLHYQQQQQQQQQQYQRIQVQHQLAQPGQQLTPQGLTHLQGYKQSNQVQQSVMPTSNQSGYSVRPQMTLQEQQLQLQQQQQQQHRQQQQAAQLQQQLQQQQLHQQQIQQHLQAQQQAAVVAAAQQRSQVLGPAIVHPPPIQTQLAPHMQPIAQQQQHQSAPVKSQAHMQQQLIPQPQPSRTGTHQPLPSEHTSRHAAPPQNGAIDVVTNPQTSTLQLAEFASVMVYTLWHTRPNINGAPNNAYNVAPRRLSVPPSAGPAFKKFCLKVLSATQLSSSVILLSLKYIQKLLKNNPSIHGQQGSEFRLFTVSLMLANKFLDDNTFTNKTWSDVTGISVREINVMEMEFLNQVKFSLFVSEGEYLDWLHSLETWLKQQGQAQV